MTVPTLADEKLNLEYWNNLHYIRLHKSGIEKLPEEKYQEIRRMVREISVKARHGLIEESCSDVHSLTDEEMEDKFIINNFSNSVDFDLEDSIINDIENIIGE